MQFQPYDVIIVGAGVSGLYAAINLDSRLKVLLLAKKEFTLCNSALAQGGVAAVLDKQSDDVERHISDTLAAGGYENNLQNLRILVENGASNIEELVRLGVHFDREPDGTIALGLEGGHSRNRIAHYKDSTGYEIVTALIQKVKSLANVDYLEYAHLLRLEKHQNGFCAEVYCENTVALRYSMSSDLLGAEPRPVALRYYYTTPICLIATGGIGRVYHYTTNSAIATGDGIQLAHNLGAKVEKMSLIQFHPTAFAGAGGSPDISEREAFLITEAARGEGAFLYNRDMERFMHRYEPQIGETYNMELSPRDVVSRCIIAEQKRTGSGEFYLDISHLDSDFIKERFPMIYGRLLEKGYDFTKQPVPIYPCQHYLMGGIAVTGEGKTTVEGLYAAGECAYTGVHGVNRLASNSLLEALVFSRLAAESINAELEVELERPRTIPAPCAGKAVFALTGTKPLPEGLRSEIRAIMQKAFFVVPDLEQAQKGLTRVTAIKALLESGEFELTPDFAEAKSLATVAYLILKEVIENVT